MITRPVFAAIVSPLLFVLVAATAPDARTPDRQGDLLVVDPSNTSSGLQQGDRATVFALLLPADASCPGDSRNDQWRVQAFIVPSAVDLATLQLTNAGPRGANESVLFNDAPPSPFVDELTYPNNAPGTAGAIAELPAFSFDTRVAPDLESGSYRLVVACTLFREIDRYWDTEWAVTSSGGSGGDSGFTWQVTGTVLPPADGSGGVPTKWIIRAVAIAAALGALGYLIARRTSTDRPAATKEHSA